MREIEELNAHYGLDDALRFETGDGGLTRARIATPEATAEVYLQGAHVTRWHPSGSSPSSERDVLYLSPLSRFVPGKAIRGGVPLVFPWFADREGGLPGAAHGFARTLEWEVAAASRRDSEVVLTLRQLPNQATRDLGFDQFVLLYEVAVGRELRLSLDVENLGEDSLQFEEALHAYFAVSSIRQVTVSGLAGTEYLDRADQGHARRQETAAIDFTGETDRLYLDTMSTVTVTDPGWRRAITIEKRGSASTVVWNPWSHKAEQLSDLGAEAWPRMVCVEPANAQRNAVTLVPGGRHAMGMTVRVAAL